MVDRTGKRTYGNVRPVNSKERNKKEASLLYKGAASFRGSDWQLKQTSKEPDTTFASTHPH